MEIWHKRKITTCIILAKNVKGRDHIGERLQIEDKAGNIRISLIVSWIHAPTVAVDKEYASHIKWVCVCVCVCVILRIQHAMRMRHIVICGLAGCTLSHKRQDFRKRKTEGC